MGEALSSSGGPVDPWLTKTLGTISIGDVERVAVDQLVLDGHVRQETEDCSHSRVLASLELDWPPIYVHRSSMRVLDGIHRVRAASRRGESTIAVRFVDCSIADAFVLAVRANTTFGKPLTLAERERAALRILRSHPQWSDRLIAEACGLSGKTVAAVRRRCSTEEIPQPNSHRIGRDGRARPTNPTQARHRAASLLSETPTASLREVARQVGLSPATVKDVRDRLRRGERPPGDTPGGTQGAARSGVGSDAALRATTEGRQFVHWLASRQIAPGEWHTFVPHIPASRIYLVADEARAIAEEWRRFAEELESRARVSRKSR